MAITAKISPVELTAQVTDRFADSYFEARLIAAAGTSYSPGITVDADFLAFEVTPGTSGYQRAVISYASGDVSAYTDDGVALSTRATIFAHDGINAAINFSHIALVWSDENILTLGAVTGAPTAGVDGTYTNIPIDSTDGTGVLATVDLTITNGGAASTDYAVTINKPGYGYTAAVTLTILESTLVGLGAVAASAGSLTFSVGTSTSQTNAGSVLAVAETPSEVSLAGGNEAAFYWNLKQFGFYNVA